MKKSRIRIYPILLALFLCALCCAPAFAATGGSGVVNNVVFPALDMILAIAFFGKLGMAYFDYKQRNQFEWTGPVILFACLVFTLTAPMYIWSIVGL